MQSEKGVLVAIPLSQIDSQSALASWLLGWFAGATDEEKEAMIHSVYGLWLARNEARDGKKIASPHEITESVWEHMSEWRSLHAPKVRVPVPKIAEKWKPPDEGWLKINSDGATSKHGNSAGGGAVIRDHEGTFRGGFCQYFPHVADPEAAEILACRRAIKVALDRNVQKVYLELDSQAVVQMIKQKERNLSPVGPWVQEIKAMPNSVEEFSVSWVQRYANVAAHKLARIGVGE
ncbi:uncharacterized protein [Aegilops tauschii subsp. strangulata]|uniref:uncharacterized protein n=1 Tax=Aegilops tauschii subsp. strangulata TaxID=200361 RepID=UPI00098ACAA8|nr:uncharacterized protein LOC109747534 [Aegilops tauschii subsp. strangulata]